MSGSDYMKVAQAISFISAQVRHQPTLHEIAAHVGLSDFHFQRLFQRWAGISPKRFVQYLTLQAAKAMLAQSQSLLQTSEALGLSGTGRLHDLFIVLEKMTPGEYKAQASGMKIHWAVHETAFGPALFAAAPRGLCGLSFIESDHADEALADLRERWPGAVFEKSVEVIAPYAEQFASRLQGRTDQPLHLLLKGTDFQVRAWEALLRIPSGNVTSYSDLAQMVGAPRAARAMGTAIGANPIACLIPCHRVIARSGVIGEYRWGSVRKQALLAFEQARQGKPQHSAANAGSEY
jgi:AraC family transcriptional regulator of adaptative response/methylated-DNA-[protein]-cysteine methyltransferase